jgi:hypothetical protein
MNFEVRTIPSFEKEFKRLFKKYPSLKRDLEVLIKLLEVNPHQGIALGKGFYKIRLTITSKSKGKSGGARVITFVRVSEHIIYLASIYDKSETSSITNTELKLLSQQIG